MARRLIPLLDRVLVERIVAPTKSAGGVLLPESAAPKVTSTLSLQQPNSSPQAARLMVSTDVCRSMRE